MAPILHHFSLSVIKKFWMWDWNLSPQKPHHQSCIHTSCVPPTFISWKSLENTNNYSLRLMDHTTVTCVCCCKSHRCKCDRPAEKEVDHFIVPYLPLTFMMILIFYLLWFTDECVLLASYVQVPCWEFFPVTEGKSVKNISISQLPFWWQEEDTYHLL